MGQDGAIPCPWCGNLTLPSLGDYDLCPFRECAGMSLNVRWAGAVVVTRPRP